MVEKLDLWGYNELYMMVRAGRIDCKTSDCCLYLESEYMKECSLLSYEGGGYV